MTRYLACDVGDRRVGLAVADDTFAVSRALPTLRRRALARDVRAVCEIADREGAAVLVVGLPLTLAGQEGHQAQRVRRFSDALAAAGRQVVLYDERHTTAEARRLGAADDDAASAGLLLEDYLRDRTRR